ncbi:hypothetical protein CCY99_08080 [Helicobacter sp. 16-1353]|uniref:hypothetical protein n=1 Tax=Helicobacter sp. 16-1353 TaxID=2004996 RepID=UPI000DCB0717|nr:hypothetical protein [Helicobacter sp. 16-1353]RAX51907.1 hypothetical protein CCY99_08080 [Helicobacter sp. 16-1353]
MKCIICDRETKYYFTTDFTTHHQGKFKDQLDKSEFYKCINCGFTFSKTLYEMPYEKWCELNLKAHTLFESQHLDSRLSNQPPYLAQASMINILATNNIIQNNLVESSQNGGGGAVK